MAAVATGFRIGETNTWATKVPLPSRNDDETQSRTPIAIHFVIDNSQSMGSMTREVITAFSSLVDSAATKPCSLTLFGCSATLVSAGINTTKQMLDLPDMPQGMTDIPAGVKKAIDLIVHREQEKKSKAIQDRTHHILVLLTDGIHNSGPVPSVEFPKIGKECMATIPEVQLSVVLVGITRNSSTSMGMLLKTSLETVPLNSDIVKNIYFASTQSEVKSTAAKLVDGLDRISTARVSTVSHPDAILVSDIGFGLASTISFRANDSTKTILIESKELPSYLVVDGTKVAVVNSEIVDHEFITEALLERIDRIKIQQVASAEPQRVRAAIEQLHVLIDGLAKQLVTGNDEGAGLKLSGMRGSDRLAQHRHLFRTMHMARELRNELEDVANFTANNSEEQAAFLTGGKSKFASKALKRAAVRSTDGTVLDPMKELKKVFKEVSSRLFIEDLTSRLRVDVMTHLARLSQDQIKDLEKYVRGASIEDFKMLRLILQKRILVLAEISSETNPRPTGDYDPDPGVTRAMKELVDSGSLAGYLNEVFFGRRQSYLSLASPWEHISEWRDFSESETALHSQWEMLMYLGSVACPITVERNAAAQMDPFQLSVKKIQTTLVDTASLCCSNHSEIDTYGPEGGEPIKDALVLVDPSCPRASAKILSTSLLGETYTSVVVSRDLHMYSGSSMKIALLANSLFRCLMPESTRKTKPDIIAELRRQFLGKAYQCGSCGFGPVDHGGCSDLFSHHGERQRGGVASNACPSCGWFSADLDDWKPWDGKVPATLVKEERALEHSQKHLYSKMDMVLRILYSFRKQFGGRDNAIKQQYQEYAQKLVNWDLSFTTTDGVQSLTQLIISIMVCDDGVVGDEKSIEAAFAPPVVLAIVNEACARAARKKFRMASGGDEVKTQDMAAICVTKMLGVTKASAPMTTESLLESEPARSVVLENCSQAYEYEWRSKSDDDVEKEEIAWSKKIAIRWCHMFDMAKTFRLALLHREGGHGISIARSHGGGWQQLERDMETSLDSYKDVVHALQNTMHCDSSLACKMCDIFPETANRTWATMAAQAFLYNRGSSRHDLNDVRCGETLRGIARDMRMRIYEERVQTKMKTWAAEGQQLAFLKARACDIGQYYDMLGIHNHVHALSKEMFWGLWEAAIYDGYGGEKVEAFLATANDGFRHKHRPTCEAALVL